MKLIIEELSPKDVVGLWLEHQGDSVAILARGSRGIRYQLATLLSTGVLKLNSHVSEELGFDTTSAGKIIVE